MTHANRQPMHDRAPPANVNLQNAEVRMYAKVKFRGRPHRLPYTPMDGLFCSRTLCSHRSGLKICASLPKRSSFLQQRSEEDHVTKQSKKYYLLYAAIDVMILVPLGMRSSCTVLPNVVIMGRDKGRTSSLIASL
jgi:hypothetical protein